MFKTHLFVKYVEKQTAEFGRFGILQYFCH